MISVICVYNDKKILDEWLLKSLKNQTVQFELITIDNTQGMFKSAAGALNYGGKEAKGKYIMFVHQDVDLTSNSWLEDAEKILESIPDLGIAGVAGMSEEYHPFGSRWRTIIQHGDPPQMVSPMLSKPIQNPERVQTLDECLVIIPKSVFNVLTFDEKVCDDWHLYAVDYCLSVKKLGLGIYAIPIFIYHRSMGVHTFLGSQPIPIYPRGYYQTLEKVLKKHKNYFKRIYTTTGFWSTSYPLILQRIIQATKGVLISKRLWKKF